MEPARFVIFDISRWLLIYGFEKDISEVLESFPLTFYLSKAQARQQY